MVQGKGVEYISTASKLWASMWAKTSETKTEEIPATFHWNRSKQEEQK